jgi:hypothetical protein
MSPKIRWAHACNTLPELRAAFDTGLEAIEADVSWNEKFQVAVMKHASTSNEQLIDNECLANEWLKEALKVNRNRVKILKLDFKSLKAVPSVVDIVAKNLRDDSPEIFLNADILKGPGTKPESTPPVDAMRFLEYCRILPDATLSLGWTTAYSPFSTIRYEHEHVDEMISILKETGTEKVTFPIRASLAFDSWPALSRLLDHSPQTSLTLWTAHEGVPESDINWIISVVEEHRVYVDCDKGPKHPHWHPARLVSYDWVGIVKWHLKS